MESTGLEHSDSDSGESCIIVEEPEPSNSVNLPLLVDSEKRKTIGNVAAKKMFKEYSEDEDTDVSVISDSDPESISFSDALENNENTKEFNYEPIASDEIIVDNNSEYVRNINKILSRVFKIIVMACVITVAGMAVRHIICAMKDEHVMHNVSQVNSSSNLLKLHKENLSLQRVIKERLQDTTIYKNKKCEIEVFEEPFTIEKFYKMVDYLTGRIKCDLEQLLREQDTVQY